MTLFLAVVLAVTLLSPLTTLSLSWLFPYPDPHFFSTHLQTALPCLETVNSES
jgi:hypothetical protein